MFTWTTTTQGLSVECWDIMGKNYKNNCLILNDFFYRYNLYVRFEQKCLSLLMKDKQQNISKYIPFNLLRINLREEESKWISIKKKKQMK